MQSTDPPRRDGSSATGAGGGPDAGHGTEFLQLDAAQAPAGQLSGWLAERIRAAIGAGTLPVGDRLPATRVLADELGVSRGVVTEAYRRLVEDGRIAGRGRAGTVVVDAPPSPDTGTAGPVRIGPAVDPRPGPVSDPFTAPPDTGVFDALRRAPARFDLSPGVPDLGAFPRGAWLQAERSVLAGLESSGLAYGEPSGAPRFRRSVAAWLGRTRGILADPDEIIVVAGVAQALGLLGRVLPERGVTEVAVEEPGSLGARQALAHWGLATPPVPVDDAGVDVAALTATGAPAVLLTPAHQFPTGVVLEGGRRRELLRWSDAGGLVVEDDYDAEHRYDRPPVPALRSLRPEAVVHCGTVSKWLAPALRVGWLLAPPRLRPALLEAKRFTDLGNPVLPQLVLAELMDSGRMERQLRVVRARHRRRRDAMLAALARHLPSAAVHGTAAGLHLMITFAASDGAGAAPDTALALAALRRGVKVAPLSWHRQRPGPPGLVLGYAAHPPGETTEAVALLSEAVAETSTGRRPQKRSRA